jgi:hypothetical protein
MTSSFRAPFSDDELDFIERQIEKRKPNGRPPAEHKWEWVRRYYELMAEHQEAHDNHHEDGDRPPTRLGICELIDPRSGGRAVWKLIRPLVENDERILRKARARRYPALYVLYLGARLAQLEPLGPKPLEQAVTKPLL